MAGPVAFCAVGPSDGGVDVYAEQVGEDRGGQVGGEVDQGGAAGDTGLDAVLVELADEAVDGQVTAGNQGAEEPCSDTPPFDLGCGENRDVMKTPDRK
ncbi:MAG TPA: hypothetical protein VG253_07855 [Streptosporangiaceae bacterium]|nr:hypothetical protein [Streptosporangiaceae bacterium]